MRRLIVVKPHGFCSGVARAVETAEAVLRETAGKKVYCLHEIVHNTQIVERLSQAGMIFVKSVEDVPRDSLLLFSAHGVSPDVRRAAETRGLKIVDATCPFVAKVHAEVRRYAAQGREVLCIGHRLHNEVAGVAGEAPGHVRIVENAKEAEALPDSHAPLAVVTQTTLGADLVDGLLRILRAKFSSLLVPNTTEVCYATRNRQEAVRALAKRCSSVLVLGSANSSNSLRLVETAKETGADARLVSALDGLAAIKWPANVTVGITSGASTRKRS